MDRYAGVIDPATGWRDIRAGQVYVTTYGLELPFGGVEKSGHGWEKGFEGPLAYTQVTSVVVRT